MYCDVGGSPPPLEQVKSKVVSSACVTSLSSILTSCGSILRKHCVLKHRHTYQSTHDLTFCELSRKDIIYI